MRAHWYTGIVTGIHELAPQVRSFTLEIPEVDCFEFKAGQFVTFDLPVSEKRINRWRSYSIASPPDQGNKIELCIVHFEGGIGSTYFFNEIRLGSELRFKGPEGGFVLPESLDHDLVMICTGTGIAPFRSMLLDIKQRGVAHQGLHLIFGTRKKEDILYREEWSSLEKEVPGFRFDIALSREFPGPDWASHMHQGYVHPVYQKAYAVYRPDVHFYLCGWTKMIDEAIANLFAGMRYPREQIHYELYG